VLRLTGHIERLLVVLLYGPVLLRGLEEIDKVPDELLLLVGHRGGVCGIKNRVGGVTRKGYVYVRLAKGGLTRSVINDFVMTMGCRGSREVVRRARERDDRGSKSQCSPRLLARSDCYARGKDTIRCTWSQNCLSGSRVCEQAVRSRVNRA
jgi:hypothetical protein